METWWHDLRYGIRMLLRQPGFTAVAALTLALGIGANTAIFSVLDAVLLRPLPYARPDSLATMWSDSPDGQTSFPYLGLDTLQEWREQKQLFEQVEAHDTRAFVLTAGAEPEQVVAELVSPGLFSVLGESPRLGRSFVRADAEAGNNRVALIGNGFWQRHFSADPNAVGKTVTLDDQAYTIVGVMPPGFTFPRKDFELWVPLSLNPATEAERRGRVEVVARLRAGLPLAAAQTEIKVAAQRLNQEKPTRSGWNASLHRLDEYRVKPGARRAMWILFGAVGFVLLIACANAANLLLARAAAREREISIRAALGAGRLRLVRQLLTESMALAALGGVGGVLLALWGVDEMTRLVPRELTFLSVSDISVDKRVLLFTLGVSCLTGVICGLMPALKVSRPDLNQALKGLTRSATSDRAHNRLRHALVIAEVGLSFVLLIGAGLMIRSFLRLSHMSPGFDTRNLLAVQLSLPRQRYPAIAHQRAFFNQLTARVAALPGVEAVTVASDIPPRSGGFSFDAEVEVEGRAPEKLGSTYLLPFKDVDDGYFRTMRIPLLRGRTFNAEDTSETPPVIIINDDLARRFWPHADPVGQRLRFASNRPWLTVVGVVGDVKAMGLSDANGTMEFYYSSSQDKSSGAQKTLVVRTAADPTKLIAAVKSQIWVLDQKLPLSRVSTAAQMMDESLAEARFYLLLMAVFAGISILLAAVGIYGVMSYSVTQRTQEIGVRVALGAQTSDVLKLIVGHGLRLVLIGVTLGMAAAWALTRVLSSLLFEVSATDPATFAVIALTLTGVALLACYIPARRAMKVDPMVALRYE